MDWNSRFITAVVALFGTFSLLVIGLWWAIGIDPAPSLQPVDARAVRPALASAPRRSYLRGSEAMRARARIDELETQLDRSQRLIERKNQSLDLMRGELLELRQRASEAEALSGMVFSAAQNHVETQEPSIDDALLGFDEPEILEQPDMPDAESLPMLEGEDPVDGAAETDGEAAGTADMANELMALRQALANVESELVLTQLARAEVVKAIGADGLDGLIASLESPRAEVRVWACDALGEMGLAAADAFAVLQQMRNDPNQRVRDRAAWALTQVRE